MQGGGRVDEQGHSIGFDLLVRTVHRWLSKRQNSACRAHRLPRRRIGLVLHGQRVFQQENRIRRRVGAHRNSFASIIYRAFFAHCFEGRRIAAFEGDWGVCNGSW